MEKERKKAHVYACFPIIHSQVEQNLSLHRRSSSLPPHLHPPPSFPGFFLRPCADDVLALGLAEADVRGRGGVVDEKGGDENAITTDDAEEGVYLLGWEREGGREGGREVEEVR